MKLVCQLEVRSQQAPSSCGRKACACTLALCKDAKGLPVLLACTKQNMAGQKYEVRNLKRVYSKFLKDGMATFSFAAPPHDLLVRKADPLQLRSFIHFLSSGEKANLRFSAPPTRVAPPEPKKMVVTRRGDLPRSFPKSLKDLTITGLGLIKLPGSVQHLDCLTSLDLSYNAFETLPPELGSFPHLLVLSLAWNKLSVFTSPPKFAVLADLNLSHNQLSSLPEEVCGLSMLETLDVCNNQLTCLPEGMGRLRKLRVFRASFNKIQVLPSSLQSLRLDHMDLFQNPLSQTPTRAQTCTPHRVPSLGEWASQLVLQHGLPYSRESLPYTLVDYLSRQGRFCAVCSRPVCTSAQPAVTLIDIKAIAFEIICIDTKGRVLAPIEVVKCLRHSQGK